jgi:hypothetical protein
MGVRKLLLRGNLFTEATKIKIPNFIYNMGKHCIYHTQNTIIIRRIQTCTIPVDALIAQNIE